VSELAISSFYSSWFIIRKWCQFTLPVLIIIALLLEKKEITPRRCDHITSVHEQFVLG